MMHAAMLDRCATGQLPATDSTVHCPASDTASVRWARTPICPPPDADAEGRCTNVRASSISCLCRLRLPDHTTSAQASAGAPERARPMRGGPQLGGIRGTAIGHRRAATDSTVDGESGCRASHTATDQSSKSTNDFPLHPPRPSRADADATMAASPSSSFALLIDMPARVSIRIALFHTAAAESASAAPAAAVTATATSVDVLVLGAPSIAANELLAYRVISRGTRLSHTCTSRRIPMKNPKTEKSIERESFQEIKKKNVCAQGEERPRSCMAYADVGQ